jgi:hypothetical protein
VNPKIFGAAAETGAIELNIEPTATTTTVSVAKTPRRRNTFIVPTSPSV